MSGGPIRSVVRDHHYRKYGIETMKNTALKLLSGLMLLGCVLPAMAEPNSSMTLRNDEVLNGTFQGYHMGQILMKTDNNLDVELPAMALFFGTDPWVQQANLKVGDHLTVTLPARTAFSSYGIVNDQNVLGSYNGVARIPQSIVSTWTDMNYVAQNR